MHRLKAWVLEVSLSLMLKLGFGLFNRSRDFFARGTSLNVYYSCNNKSCKKLDINHFKKYLTHILEHGFLECLRDFCGLRGNACK